MSLNISAIVRLLIIKTMAEIVNGVDKEVFEKGWWGCRNDVNNFLRHFSLPADQIPFDVNKYLSGETVCISLNGREFNMSVSRNEQRIEFTLSTEKKERKWYLYYEWMYEDYETVLWLESYAIGEGTRNILLRRSLLV